jgi:hypothetical protein
MDSEHRIAFLDTAISGPSFAMNMIAATYHLETPSTLLRRVEQLENETLPSLPSCTMEYDSEIDTSGEDLSLDVMRKQGDEEVRI